MESGSHDHCTAESGNTNGCNTVKILVVGTSGNGKSTLVNGIMGKPVARVGKQSTPGTKYVQGYDLIEAENNGIKVVVYDSPGLLDGNSKENKYFEEMKMKCGDVHLVMFAIRMDNTRFNKDSNDYLSMKYFTEAFGKEIWRKTMIVLTFANKVEDPDLDDEDTVGIEKHFAEKLDEWTDNLQSIMEDDLNIPKRITFKVPIVPAGIAKKPHLPGHPFWFSEMWHKLVNTMPLEIQIRMVNFVAKRLKSEKNVTEDCFQGDLHEQPIVVNARSKILGVVCGMMTAYGFSGVFAGPVIGLFSVAAGGLCTILSESIH